jgi:hypothetical protein
VTDANGDPVAVTITSVFQDEPLTGCPDASGVGTATASLRADRALRRNGRVYHLKFSADDGRGGTCTGMVTVCVPKDHRANRICKDEGSTVDSTVLCRSHGKKIGSSSRR